MKSSGITAVAIALLPFAVTAQAEAWTPYISSTDASLNGLPVVAWNGQFVVGDSAKPTTAVCPDYDLDCPAKNVTIISGLSADGGNAELWMGVLQEGGQKAYWHEPPKTSFMRQYSYLWSYTAASSGSDAGIPVTDVVGDLFTITNGSAGYGVRGGLKLATVWTSTSDGTERPTTVFGLCTVGHGDDQYQRVTVEGGKYCYPVEIEVRKTELAAPQFYGCDGCELRSKNDDLAACGPPFCSDSYPLYS